MTALQLKEEFLLLYDAISNFAAPGYENSEISKFLTIAQLDIINSLLPTGDKVELEKKVFSALITPFTTSIFNSNNNNFPNGVYIDLPDDMIVVWTEYVNFNNGAIVEVKPIPYDYYVSNISNPFVNPCSTLVWRVDVNGKHELITDGSTITKYVMRYIRRPVDIDIDTNQSSELLMFHEEIVKGAVKLAIDTVTRYQAMQNRQQP